MGRPLVTNVCPILGGNLILSIFRISSSIVKPHIINIALIVHAHDRRAVARDGLLRNGLRGEAGIALRRRGGLRAGGAGHGFGFRKGIVVIIGVLLPMDDGILRVFVRRPDGVKRQRLIERIPESERRVAALGFRPVFEGIAGAGGGGGRGGRAVALYERGRDIGAALRIVGDPVAVLNDGSKGDIVIVQRNGGNDIAAFFILPADDGLLIADGVGHALRGNRIAVIALLRDHNLALLVGEEHEVHVRELGVIGNRFRFGHGDRAEGGSLVIVIEPASELLIRAAGFRRAGVVEDFAVLDDLAGEFLRAIHEDVRRRRNRLLHNAEQRNAGAGLRAAGDGHDGRQRVHGRAADEHDQRHQQGKTPTKLVFHKKLILPMKFR